jgi:rhamnosyltransferase
MKIAACVILYNPDNSVSDNISSYITNFDKTFIFDNSEKSWFDINQLSNHNSDILFINDGENKGISKRLNQACDLAIENNCDFLLTMDQDSFFESDAITNYLNCIQLYTEKEKVAMFGVNYENRLERMNCKSVQKRLLITSGSIINLEVYKNVGRFDENLFIDFVDTEYCFRSILKNYSLISFQNIYMHHQIGSTYNKVSLKNLKKNERSLHSSVRLYYMTRNFFYLKNLYNKHFKKEISIHRKDLLNRLKNKFLYGKGRIDLLKLIIKSYFDYKREKMGRQI